MFPAFPPGTPHTSSACSPDTTNYHYNALQAEERFAVTGKPAPTSGLPQFRTDFQRPHPTGGCSRPPPAAPAPRFPRGGLRSDPLGQPGGRQGRRGGRRCPHPRWQLRAGARRGGAGRSGAGPAAGRLRGGCGAPGCCSRPLRRGGRRASAGHAAERRDGARGGRGPHAAAEGAPARRSG